MVTKHRLTLATLAAALATLAASAAAAAPSPGSASLVIRHQLHGCHSWALNGGAYNPTQAVALRAGASLTVTDNDVMPHLLVQTAGPAASFARVRGSMPDVKTSLRGPGLMAHMGAQLKVTFSKPGVYRFTTKAGEDYVAGVKTIGEDNVLRLTVAVTR